ncbi:hypothetical protein ACLOJK_012614 [Asimina triloba]
MPEAATDGVGQDGEAASHALHAVVGRHSSPSAPLPAVRPVVTVRASVRRRTSSWERVGRTLPWEKMGFTPDLPSFRPPQLSSRSDLLMGGCRHDSSSVLAAARRLGEDLAGSHGCRPREDGGAP